MKPRDVAATMGIPEANLWHLCRHQDKMYRPTRMRRFKQKTRPIDEPQRRFKSSMKKLHRRIQKEVDWNPCVHGGIKGHSCFTSARPHIGKHVACRDIKDCYPSVTTAAIRRALCRQGLRSDTAWVLSRLFTLNGSIPQGSPLSSDALNLFLSEVDEKIAAEAAKHGGTYTRVYDDFVTSAQDRDVAEALGDTVEGQVCARSMSINERKKQKSGLQPRHRRPRVHNILVNSPRGTRIPPEQNQEAIDLAHSLVRGCKAVSPDSLIALAKKRRRVFGHCCHLRQAAQSSAKHVGALIKAADRAVLRRLRQAGLSAHKNKWWILSKQRSEPGRLAGAWRRALRGTATTSAPPTRES